MNFMSCFLYNLNISQTDIESATGNTDVLEIYNNVVVVEYINCDGIPSEYIVGESGSFENLICVTDLSNPSISYYQNNIKAVALSSSVTTNNIGCSDEPDPDPDPEPPTDEPTKKLSFNLNSSYNGLGFYYIYNSASCNENDLILSGSTTIFNNSSNINIGLEETPNNIISIKFIDSKGCEVCENYNIGD